MRLDSVPPQLTGVTAYSAQTSQVTYDITYDLWLQPDGTTRPCRSRARLRSSSDRYSARALLPASLQVGTATIPLAVDRVIRRARSPGRSTPATSMERTDRSVGRHPWFVPSEGDIVRPRPRERRSECGASRRRPPPARQLRLARARPGYWLDTASFGIEYGPPSGDPLDSGSSRSPRRFPPTASTCGARAGRRLRVAVPWRYRPESVVVPDSGARQALGEGADAQPARRCATAGHRPRWHRRRG